MDRERITAQERGGAPVQRRRTSPETLRLRRAWPTFTVGDIGTSLKFYRDTLGFVVDEIWEREGRRVGAALLAGSVQIMLSEDDGAKGAGRDKGLGFRLHLTTIQDIDALAESVVARGGALETPPEEMPWGVRAFTVVDPDGYRLTISSEG